MAGDAAGVRRLVDRSTHPSRDVFADIAYTFDDFDTFDTFDRMNADVLAGIDIAACAGRTKMGT
ncbi:hypothetical protein [Streptomyces sp. NPDC094149]|uniref:hypothetical protein n=1 Tax=Streptomyces sp. NPDC094149 TaxID=3155079 RepID=UPI00332E033F